MKKFFIIITLCLVHVMCFALSPGQQKAIDEVKAHLHCPSTFRLVKLTYLEGVQDESEVENKKVYYSNVTDNGEFFTCDKIWTITVDSIKYQKITPPEVNVYIVEYDAQNLYGALVREKEYIHVYNNRYYTLNSWINVRINYSIVENIITPCHYVVSKNYLEVYDDYGSFNVRIGWNFVTNKDLEFIQQAF